MKAIVVMMLMTIVYYIIA